MSDTPPSEPSASGNRLAGIIAIAVAVVGLASAALDLPQRFREAFSDKAADAAQADSVRRFALLDSMYRVRKRDIAAVRARVDSVEESTLPTTPHVKVYVVNTCQARANVAIQYIPVRYSRAVTRGWFELPGGSRDSIEAWVKGASFSYFAEFVGYKWSRPDDERRLSLDIQNEVFADDGTIVWEGRDIRRVIFSTKKLPRETGATVTIPIRCASLRDESEAG